MKVIINHELSQELMQELLAEFKALDQDKNGEISFSDLLSALQKHGLQISENELFKVFRKIHENDLNSTSTAQS